MMSGNWISYEMANNMFQSSMLGSGCGMIDFSGDFAVVGICFGCKIRLPFGGKLSEVMP